MSAFTTNSSLDIVACFPRRNLKNKWTKPEMNLRINESNIFVDLESKSYPFTPGLITSTHIFIFIYCPILRVKQVDSLNL